ncbi:MAG: acyl-CoA thioesterase [Calditrichaeota bacterium]|nr:MAG: acyl-CoA thioesterase [Calditrichota bacterium]
MNELKDFPVTIEVPVHWGEMDAFQHLNNTVYFRYFESARIAYFQRLDYMSLVAQTGVGPILASTSCKFIIPLTYPDKVTVAARVPKVQLDRFTMEYLIFSQTLQKTAAVGEGLVVSYDYNQKQKAPLPQEIIQRILELEGPNVQIEV